MKKILTILLTACTFYTNAQLTPFEKSTGTETATYFEAVDFYKKLATTSTKIKLQQMGQTDAGYPLHLVLISNNKNFNPATWHSQNKAVILINNGIHPGEPDGIDASMMLARDISIGKLTLPDNVCLGIIPVYNIGGSLNRGPNSRANQNGPKEYGFRGNSQNLDLNRDFTKNDSKESKSFIEIFHYLNPDILIDNHVSDGADYQYTMTLLTTQYEKLGNTLGNFLKTNFEPGIYDTMKKNGWDMCPYVNFEEGDITKGIDQFYDPPRYSSGYAALFNCIGFVPETHMLKPFKDRVLSTYALSKSIIEVASTKCNELKEQRKKAIDNTIKQPNFTLGWVLDSTVNTSIQFKGYEAGTKPSLVTGMNRMYYNRIKPYEKTIPYYNTFKAIKPVQAPKAYIIPAGWHAIIDLLKLNKVQLSQFTKDTVIQVDATKIETYKTSQRAYEKHYRHTDLVTSTTKQTIKFLKGDYIIYLNQKANRFLVEMLEPTGDDSYFTWNFFDGILQQKEGYSDYRWEDLAAEVLAKNPTLKQQFDDKIKTDAAFAKNAGAQLNWVYKNSQYFEPSVNRYPVYRVEK